MKQVGITGAPYTGKTTFFNALTHAGASSGGGGKANVAVVPVPDSRVDELSRRHASKKSVYAQLKFTDVAGLATAGLSAQVLGALREVDALAIVVRAYGDDADPAAELADVALELALADLGTLSAAADRAAKKGRTGDKAAQAEADLLRRAAAVLEAGRALRTESWAGSELTAFRNFGPLTLKPALVVLNTEDESAVAMTPRAAELAATLGAGTEGIAVPARLEAEVGGMAADEAAELLAEFGVTVGALPSVIASSYRMLGLLTFLTTGDDESRAWELRRGATAPEAAGAIHSDLQRGFIRAEVVSYADLLDVGTWDAARGAGKLRVEGKDYVVQEADVMNIRFAV